MTRETKVMLPVTGILILALICNFVLAKWLYARSFDPSYRGVTFFIRGGDAESLLLLYPLPEETVGRVLSLLLVRSFLATILFLGDDVLWFWKLSEIAEIGTALSS